MPPDSVTTSGPLVLANADPQWLDSVIDVVVSEFASFDLHYPWISVRTAEILNCLRRVDLVTVTASEYKELPVRIVRSAALGLHGGPSVIIKDGARGVLIQAQGKSIEQPAPAVDAVKCDIGAGDFLLGLISGYLANMRVPPPFAVTDIASAYKKASDVLPILLGSSTPREFLDLCIAQLP